VLTDPHELYSPRQDATSPRNLRPMRMMRFLMMQSLVRGSVLTLAAGLVSILPAGEASAVSASGRWLRPVVIARTCNRGVVTPVKLAQNARGDIVLAWAEQGCNGPPGVSRVFAVSRPAGRRFGSKRMLASTRALPYISQLGVAIDARGAATIAWSSANAGQSRSRVLVATRQRGGRFGAPVSLDEHGLRPALSGTADGEAVLVWQQVSPPGNDAHTGYVVAATRMPGASRFGPAQAISDQLHQAHNQYTAFPVVATPAISVAPDGTALASWTRADGTALDCCTAVEASVRPPGGDFSAPVRLSPALPNTPDTTSGTGVAAADNGAVAWTTDDSTNFPAGGMFASRWDGHAFSAPIALMRPEDVARGTVFSTPEVLLGGDGPPTVRWDEEPGQCSPPPRRVAITLTTTAAAVAQRSLAPANQVLAGFAAAVDTSDRTVAVWVQAGRVSVDKYGTCAMSGLRVAGSINGDPPITGPRIRSGIDSLALAAAPGSTPRLVWSGGGVIVMTTLRESN